MPETSPAWYELRNAVYDGQFDCAATLLSATVGLIETTDAVGETVLHFLAVENDCRGVAWLHARGFSINTRNNVGTPVIFEVAQLEYKELFEWFVGAGVDLDALSDDGQSLAEHLREAGRDEMAVWVAKRST